MKIKNLLLVPLLSVALVATSACSPSGGGGSSSSSSGDVAKKVARITVTKLSSVVVGDEIDFDTLVDVYYDDDSKSKDYSLEATSAASAELVNISGHKVTFVKEGDVSIVVKAGDESAKFETNAVSRLKKDASEFLGGLANSYTTYLSEDKVNFVTRKVHRPNYIFFDKDNGSGQKGEGMLTFPATSHEYQFEVEGGVIEVGDRTNHSMYIYFIDFDFEFKGSEAETRNDGSSDYLYFGPEISSAYERYGFYNYIEQFAYFETYLDFDNPYLSNEGEHVNPAAGTAYTKWDSMDMYHYAGEEDYYCFHMYSKNYVVAEHTDPEYNGENDACTSSERSYEMSIKVLDGVKGAKNADIEEFISNPDNEPISEDFSKVQNYVRDNIDGSTHNYTVNAQSYFYDFSSETPKVNDEMLEVYSINEDVYDADVQGVASGTDNSFIPTSPDHAGGYAVKTGQLYSYDRSETDASKVEGKSSIYGDSDIKAKTWASLSTAALWDGLFVKDVTLDETNHTEEYALEASESVVFIKHLLSISDAGYYFLQIATSIATIPDGWYKSLDECIASGDVSITLLLDDSNTDIVGMKFDAEFFLCHFSDTGLTYFGQTLVFSDFGTTADVDLSGINFPA